jgi:hypothetical protein
MPRGGGEPDHELTPRPAFLAGLYPLTDVDAGDHEGLYRHHRARFRF